MMISKLEPPRTVPFEGKNFSQSKTKCNFFVPYELVLCAAKEVLRKVELRFICGINFLVDKFLSVCFAGEAKGEERLLFCDRMIAFTIMRENTCSDLLSEK